MKIIYSFIFIFFCFNSYAHQPKLIKYSPSENNPHKVIFPEISKAYYGKLDGEPHYYIIKSDKEFLFYTGILSPKRNENYTWLSIDIINENKEIIFKADGKNFKWEPSGKTTVKGFGTVGNLSDKKLPNLILLEKAINKELNSYFLNFKKKQIKFIQNWPKNFKIVSWSNRLKKEGHNIPHIHPSGWVSGVCYLKVPKKIKNDEAGIEFSLHGDDYKIINNNVPKKSIQPEIGDIVLFPSSLFHRTNPFSSD